MPKENDILSKYLRARRKPNFRGQYIIKIIALVRLRKEIKLDHLISEVSINAPYMSPDTARSLVEDLQGGSRPKLEGGNDSDSIIRLHKKNPNPEETTTRYF